MAQDAAASNTPVTVPDAAPVGTPPPGPVVAAPAAAPKKRRGRPPKSSRSVSPPPVAVAAAIAAATDTEAPVAPPPADDAAHQPTITSTKTRVEFTAVKLGDEVTRPGESEEAAHERFREELRQRFLAAAQRVKAAREQEEQELASGYAAMSEPLEEHTAAVQDARESLKRAIDMLSWAGVAWLVTRFLGVL